MRRVLLAHGLDLNRGDYELVALGATGQRLESMAKGETFAGILNPPLMQKRWPPDSSGWEFRKRCVRTIRAPFLPQFARPANRAESAHAVRVQAQ
jgi:hypothetical protein